MPQPSQEKELFEIEGAEKLEELVVKSSALYDSGIKGQIENVQYRLPSDPEVSLVPIAVHEQDIELSINSREFLEIHNKTKKDLLFFRDTEDTIWAGISDEREGFVLFDRTSIRERTDNTLYVSSLRDVFESFDVAYVDSESTDVGDQLKTLEYRDIPIDPREFQGSRKIFYQTGQVIHITDLDPYGKLVSEEISDPISVRLSSSFVDQHQRVPNRTYHFKSKENSELVVVKTLDQDSLASKFWWYLPPMSIGVIAGGFVGFSGWRDRLVLWGGYLLFLLIVLSVLTKRDKQEDQTVGTICPHEDTQILSLPFRLNADPIGDEERYHLLEVVEVSDVSVKFEDYDSGDTITVQANEGVLDPKQLDFFNKVGVKEVTSGNLIATEIQEAEGDQTEEGEICIANENHTYSNEDIFVKPFR
jgi:hypothetical protein